MDSPCHCGCLKSMRGQIRQETKKFLASQLFTYICESVPYVCLSHMWVCPICESVPFMSLSHMWVCPKCVSVPMHFYKSYNCYTSQPRRASKRSPEAAFLRVLLSMLIRRTSYNHLIVYQWISTFIYCLSTICNFWQWRHWWLWHYYKSKVWFTK